MVSKMGSGQKEKTRLMADFFFLNVLDL